MRAMQDARPGSQALCLVEDEARELDELVARFAHRVHFFARRTERRYGLDAHCRDDLVSAGYWGLLKALRNRRPDAHDHELSAYVSRRVEGAVVDEARRVLSRAAGRSDVVTSDLESSPLLSEAHPDWHRTRDALDPENLADRQARWQTIERVVDHLGREHCALLWSYAEGSSLSEIARRHGLSISRLQTEMSRISRQLRAHSPELRRLLRHEI